jgi:hypothetical protein
VRIPTNKKKKSVRVRNSCVEGREAKCFKSIAWGEGFWLNVLEQIFFLNLLESAPPPSPFWVTKNFSETDIIKTFEYVIDNIFTMVGGRVFLQTIGILLFLYSYGADFIQGFLKENEKKLANVASYKWKVHNGKIEIISFVIMFRS